MCQFAFSPAISFLAKCKTQEDVDELWEKLSKGGEKGQCGWLKDKYSVAWQIVPISLGKGLQDKDAEKSERVMKHYLQWIRIDIETLKRTYEQQLD
jgi:predicted 3-demethylubiquinone-9 3-methyltransferase (glyoxalase superfamily)